MQWGSSDPEVEPSHQWHQPGGQGTRGHVPRWPALAPQDGWWKETDTGWDFCPYQHRWWVVSVFTHTYTLKLNLWNKWSDLTKKEKEKLFKSAAIYKYFDYICYYFFISRTVISPRNDFCLKWIVLTVWRTYTSFHVSFSSSHIRNNQYGCTFVAADVWSQLQWQCRLA